jgi:hypothetical protein
MDYPPCRSIQTIKECTLQRIQVALSDMESSRGRTYAKIKKTSAECDGMTAKECILAKTKIVAEARDQSYIDKNRGACQGNQKLNKKAFVSMLGAPSFPKKATTSNAELEAARALEALDDNGGDFRRTASSLGITVQSLKRKLNPAQPAADPYDETGSPNGKRRYFEKLTAPWRITSFNTSNGEVCVDVTSKSNVAHLSANVQASKNY